MNQEIVIYTSNRDFAKNKIDELIEKYPKSDILKYYVSVMDIRVELKNGDFYHWVKPNSYARGVKPDISYIDIDTCSLDVIQTIIIPCNLKGNFVVLTNDYEKYDLDTLLNRLTKIRIIKGNLTDIGIYDSEYGWQNIMNTFVSDESLVLGLPV